MTPTLHIVQRTERGSMIRWTSACPCATGRGVILSGDLLGKRGRPLAGFVCARADGERVGPVRHLALGGGRGLV